MTGKSVHLDPLSHAVRPDLADVRLADQVFAPHYAAPRTMILVQGSDLRRDPTVDSEVLGRLDAGAPFELLELAAGNGWGTAPSLGLVGYVDAGALNAT